MNYNIFSGVAFLNRNTYTKIFCLFINVKFPVYLTYHTVLDQNNKLKLNSLSFVHIL